jgi:hypothetical protein
VLIGLALIMHFLDSRGYLHTPQMALGLDPMLKEGAPGTPIDVSIVKISDQDYQDYFCGKSPLDARAVVGLVEAVRERLHPSVIGVDLDTSDWKPQEYPATCANANIFRCSKNAGKDGSLADADCLRQELNELLPASQGHLDKTLRQTERLVENRSPSVSIVWAQVPAGPVPAATEEGWWKTMVNTAWKGEREETTALALQTVAGRDVGADSKHSGVPQFPVDPDSVVRRYRRWYRVVELSGTVRSESLPEAKLLASLPHAVAKECKPCVAEDPKWRAEEASESDDLILKYVGDPSVFSPIEARYLLPRVSGKLYPRPQQMEIDRALELKQPRIVLIGGTYKGARDVYRTPLGEMAGVELLAQAVETDLHKGIQEPNDVWKILADITAGFLVILLWNAKPLRHSMSLRIFFTVCVGAIFLAFTFLSKFLFQHGIWLDTAAIVLGVVAHQVWEEFDLIEEHEEKCETQEKIIARLEQQIEDLKRPSGPAESSPPAGAPVSAESVAKGEPPRG